MYYVSLYVYKNVNNKYKYLLCLFLCAKLYIYTEIHAYIQHRKKIIKETLTNAQKQ